MHVLQPSATVTEDNNANYILLNFSVKKKIVLHHWEENNLCLENKVAED